MAEAPIGMSCRVLDFLGNKLTGNSPRWRDWVPQGWLCSAGKLGIAAATTEHGALFVEILTITWNSVELPRAFIPFYCRTADPAVRRAVRRHCGQGYHVRGRSGSSSVNVTNHISGMPITDSWLKGYGSGADYGDEIDGEWYC